MKNYISINVVSQTLLFIQAIAKSICSTKSEVRQIRMPYGVNVDTAEAFAIQCKWIEYWNETLAFTSIGRQIERHFNGESIDTELWKTILYNYITICKPAWAGRIPYGRKEAFLFMNEEEQRCFIEAGLMDSYKDDILKWWDSIAETERLKRGSILDDIGRTGEKLTLLYEKERTGIIPDWRSIETNLAGYDILSRFSADDSRRLLIEVKSSAKPLDKAEALISRHEWDIACLSNNASRYLFHFWCVTNTENQLAIIDIDKMKTHIPPDAGAGRWVTMSVPFAAFTECFKKWIPNSML